MQKGKIKPLTSEDKTTSDCLSRYLPTPPPPTPQPGTNYSFWRHTLNCNSESLPLLSEHSSCAVRNAAWTYRKVYAPAEWYNKAVFKICCGGDGNCCDERHETGLVCMACFSTPRLICCSAGLFFACVAGGIGLIYDCSAPCRQTMDSENVPYQAVNTHEAKIDSNGSKPEIPQQSFSNIKMWDITAEFNNLVKKTCDQIDAWIKEDNFPEVLKLFSNPPFDLMNNPEVFQKRVFLICLAIRCTKKEITFEQRKQFITSLLTKDEDLTRSYYSTEGQIPALLLEALRSNYVDSSALLELCFLLGANVHWPICPIMAPTEPGFLQVLACYDYQQTNDDMLFYKLHLLYYYENLLRSQELVSCFKKIGLEELDQQLTTMFDPSIKKLNTAAKMKEREETRSYLREWGSTKLEEKALATLVCQYSAICSPSELAELKCDNSKVIPPELKAGTMLSQYQPLPPIRPVTL